MIQFMIYKIRLTLVDMSPNFRTSNIENEFVKNIELFIMFQKRIIQFMLDTYFAQGKILLHFLKFMKKNYLIF